MLRLARWRSQQGLLLLEAILSAVVIAVGLVMISRAIGSQLNVVRRMEAYDTLLVLADNKLQELDAAHLMADQAPKEDRTGEFTAKPYAWEISAINREDLDPEKKLEIAEIRVKVRRGSAANAESVTLTELWPRSWVPETWYQ